MNELEIDQIVSKELDPAFRRRCRYIFETILGDEKICKVLDVGCGRGYYANNLSRLKPGLEIWGIDKNPNYIWQAIRTAGTSRASFQVGDAARLPFASKTFDAVIASELLEHIPDDRQVVTEIKRVLKRGGLAVVSVPHTPYPFWWDPLNWWLERVFKKHVRPEIWWLAGIWADHVRLYSKDQLEALFAGPSWEIIKLVGCTKHCLPGAHFLFYGVGKNIVELGLFKELNRFESAGKESRLRSLLLKIINYFDDKNSVDSSGPEYVNLVAVVRKR